MYQAKSMLYDNAGLELRAEFSDYFRADDAPTPRSRLEAEGLSQLIDISISNPYKISVELRTAIKSGWAATYSLLFNGLGGRPFVPNLAPHHRRAIKWHWISRHRVCRNERPRYYAYFPIFSRGHMKSTLARSIAVVDALISMYYERPGYCLYFSGTDKKTENHARSIAALLSEFRKHAPTLAVVKREDQGSRSLGWKATFLNTQANYVFHFGSLQSGMAGANLEGVRPSMMIPDDCDSRDDSPVISEKNFKLLTAEILPMGAQGTLTFWAQNLISRFSSMYRIYKGQARVLTNRMPTKPVPAIRGLKTEVQTVDGTPRDIIIAGEPTWKYFDLTACQDEINRIGLPAFLAECCHEVEQSREGLMLKNYEDGVHPISESEFASVFGSMASWRTWHKWIFHDWARTKTQFHANVAGYLAVSSQNTPLPGFKFIVHPMSFPAGSAPEDVAERILSALSPTTLAGDDGQKLHTWGELRRDTLHRLNAAQHTATVRERLDFEHKALAEIIPKYARPVLERFNVRGGAMSHSEDTIRELYRKCYGITLSPSNPGKFDCVDEIDRDLLVDYNVPHAFRPQQAGYSRFAIVCPDWKDCPPDAIRIDERTGCKIYPPQPPPDTLSSDDLYDHDLFRFQFLNWRTRAPKLTETGERIDEVLKLHDDFGQCFVAGTLISTQFGNKPIETILVGDYVWTRRGLRRVKTAGGTLKQTEVFDLGLSTGQRLVGTANHPIYVKNQGFRALQMLNSYDMLEPLWRQTISANQNQNELFTKALCITDTLMQNNVLTGFISRHTLRRVSKAIHICTSRFGRALMEKYRRAMKSIIKIKTHLTTTSRIWSANWYRSIVENMYENAISLLKTLSIWIGFVYYERITHVLSRHENALPQPLLNVLNIHVYAFNVNVCLSRFLLIQDFVVKPAHSAVGQKPRKGGNLKRYFRKCAINVRRILKESASQNSVVPVVVVSIQPKGVANVFNLEVEDQPEYYANGVLVHNCLQMLYHVKQLTNVPLDSATIIEAHMPQTLTEQALETAPDEMKANVLQGRLNKIRELEKDLNRPAVPAGISRLRRR